MTRPTAMAPDASTSPVEWGPEIRVDGKRPEWLGAGVECAAATDDGEGGLYWYRRGGGYRADGWCWRPITAIRLPADHPHYPKAPTTPERDPLWDRMEALVRELASADGACFVGEIKHEAQSIVAELPKPVDPDEAIARDLVRYAYPEMKPDYAGRRYQIALAAIKRGRELERQGASS